MEEKYHKKFYRSTRRIPWLFKSRQSAYEVFHKLIFYIATTTPEETQSSQYDEIGARVRQILKGPLDIEQETPRGRTMLGTGRRYRRPGQTPFIPPFISGIVAPRLMLYRETARAATSHLAKCPLPAGTGALPIL